MTVSTKAPWFLFSTFVVMMLAVSTAMIAEDVGRSGTVHNARGKMFRNTVKGVNDCIWLIVRLRVVSRRTVVDCD